MNRIDLHLHSTYSDGSYSPTDVVELAHQAQVSTLCLTDHDTTDGIAEASQAASSYGIEVIPGVEVSSLYRDKETHILGYFVNHEDAQFQQHLTWLRNSRHERIPRIIDKLHHVGVDISYEDVKAAAGHGSIGRPHVAQVLVQQRYVPTIEQAFSRFLKEGSTAYVARQLPDAKEAIRWIRESGGVASLAHPGWVRQSLSELEIACRELQTCGLQGLEVFYSSHTSRQTSEYLGLAHRLNLTATGGSDFHGSTRPDIVIGVGRGNLNIPEKIVEPLRQCAKENRKTVQ
ncbi:MAG: phosphatase [Nitrospirales bacterium]|nr:MAG: phosphatase [Nitrospirales bacterium]